MQYDLKQHGFCIIKDFFSPSDLAAIELAAQNRMEKNVLKDGKNPFKNFVTKSEYDAIEVEDMRQSRPLQLLSEKVNSTMGTKLNLFNSIYFEVHGEDAAKLPGLVWHQDVYSFNIMESSTKAIITWFMTENSLEFRDGTLEFVTFKDLENHIKLDLRGKGPAFYETSQYLAKYNVDFTKKGKSCKTAKCRYSCRWAVSLGKAGSLGHTAKRGSGDCRRQPVQTTRLAKLQKFVRQI